MMPVNPAISTSSVEGREPCACSSVCVVLTMFSGGGNWNPPELSNGSPDTAVNRAVHISEGQNLVFAPSGERGWFRAPLRDFPTLPLLSTPMAIGCESPKPNAGE